MCNSSIIHLFPLLSLILTMLSYSCVLAILSTKILYCACSFTHSLHLELYSYCSIPSLSYLVDPLVLITIKKNMVLRPLDMSTLLDYTLSCYSLPSLIPYDISLVGFTYRTCYLAQLSLLIQKLLYMAIFP